MSSLVPMARPFVPTLPASDAESILVPMQDIPLYNAAAIRALEAQAFGRSESAPYRLMQRAAEALLALVASHYPAARTLHVVAGPGNNGGDGLELARIAMAAGLRVRVVATVDGAAFRGTAKEAFTAFANAGGRIHGTTLAGVERGDVIIDALFGIGLNRAPEPPYADLIEAINAAPAPCVAADIPSGLDADCGAVPGACVRVHHTVTFIAAKPGLVLGHGPRQAGRVTVASLGLACETFAGVAPSAVQLARQYRWPLRARRSYKGTHGKVLVIGGAAGMRGAGMLAATAALRGGAGMVRIASPAGAGGVWPAPMPELMLSTFERPDTLAPLLAWADVVALGPGLGRDSLAADCLAPVLAAGKPLVLDADALTLLATAPVPLARAVLTPHAGEAARLLGVDVNAIELDRLAALDQLVERYRCAVVLKGAPSLIGAPATRHGVAQGGNPGLAVAGSGDVLTGLVAAMLAAGHGTYEAARLAVSVQNAAADFAAAGGERGLAPTDVIKAIRTCVN